MIRKHFAVHPVSAWSIVLLLGAALLLSACGGTTPTPIFISEAQATQTALPPAATLAPSLPEARLQLGAVTIAGLNPLAIPDPATEAVQALIYEPLVGYDAARTLQPVLSVGLPTSSADGLTWTVDIQPDISLHDGTLLDGALVAAAFRACLETPEQGDDLALAVFRALVTDVTAEEMRVTLQLRMPFAAFPDLLAEQSLAISNGPGIGTGPFVVASSGAPGLALDAFSSYHGGEAPIAGVDVWLYGEEPDPVAALNAALNAGTLDVALGAGMAAPAGFQTWAPLPTQAMLLLNAAAAPFDRDGVREALRQVATPGAGAREALASAGLPDAFDLLVWNTQDAATAEGLLTAALDHLSASPALVPVRVDDVIQTLVDGADATPESPATDEARIPAAFVVAGREGWQQAWWLALAQNPDGMSNALAAMPISNLVQAVSRDTVQGLEVTAGGWPRVTARTIIAPGGTQ